nr:zinc knuckle CX2CX4HX4C [Tanacetum cinerariifolium]
MQLSTKRWWWWVMVVVVVINEDGGGGSSENHVGEKGDMSITCNTRKNGAHEEVRNEKRAEIEVHIENKGLGREDELVRDREDGLVHNADCSYWSMRWNLTLCGQFVGCNMTASELRYKFEENVEIGRPLIMDSMTAQMCHKGIGRFGYARVLVEVKANKELTKQIKIHYRNALNEKNYSKFVQVQYAWKQVRCEKCRVFGHNC